MVDNQSVPHSSSVIAGRPESVERQGTVLSPVRAHGQTEISS
jgi:hypothetical protein